MCVRTGSQPRRSQVLLWWAPAIHARLDTPAWEGTGVKPALHRGGEALGTGPASMQARSHQREHQVCRTQRLSPHCPRCVRGRLSLSASLVQVQASGLPPTLEDGITPCTRFPIRRESDFCGHGSSKRIGVPSTPSLHLHTTVKTSDTFHFEITVLQLLPHSVSRPASKSDGAF